MTIKPHIFRSIPLSLMKTGTSIFLISFLLFSFVSISTAHAAPKYAPGETLNPDCLPTDPDCTVTTPSHSGANTDITSLSSLTNITSGGLTIANLLNVLGSLGIGTSSPFAKLAVAGSDTSTTLIGADALTSFLGNLFDLKVASSSKFTVSANGSVNTTGNITSTGTGTSTFAGGLNVGGSAGLTVLKNGNVGIGTTTQDTMFNVNGNTNIRGNLTVGTTMLRGGMLSFGDSITYGIGASSLSNSYPYWIARSAGYSLRNLGNPGYTSQQEDGVLFANPSTGNALITYQIGTNNVNLGGASTNLENSFGLNILAQYAWLALPTANKVPFSSESVTYSGSWSASNLFGSNAPGTQCTGTSCTATFTFTGPTLILVTGAQSSANTAAATLTCNGTATKATLYFQGYGGTATPGGNGAGNVSGTMATLVTGLGSGSNSCVVTSTSSTGIVDLEWYAGLTGSVPSGSPIVLAGSFPSESPTNSNESSYRAFMPTAVTALRNAGLTNIYYVDTSNTLTPPNNYSDGLHPNDYGYYLLAAPYISTLGTALSQTLTESSYVYSTLANSAMAGQQSLGVGFNSLASNTTGRNNTAVGYGAASALTTGSYNTVLGNALTTMTTGSYNVAIGEGALGANNSTYNVGVGYQVLNKNTGTQSTAVGFQSAMNATISHGITAFGFGTLQSLTTGNGNTAVGNSALNAGTTFNYNTAVGDNALLVSTGDYNDAFGWHSLKANTTGIQNTAIGNQSLQTNTSGNFNVALGTGALQSNMTGTNNTALGYQAAQLNSTGSYMTAVGFQALKANTGAWGDAFGWNVLVASTGSQNAGFGGQALQSNTTGTSNTAVGNSALNRITSGSKNTAVGWSSGVNGSTLTTISNSTFIGYGANSSTDGLTNMIVVGYNAQGSASNQVVIGNSSITQTLLNGSVGLSTSTPWRTLSVVGTMGIQGLTSSSVGNALCITANNEVTTASVASCAGVSSQRFKHEITPTDLGLSTVLNMRPVAFRYNEGYGDSGKDQQFGLIAEDVQKIDQRLIILDGGGLPTAVRYDFLPTILIKAVQELNAKIEAFISNGIATIKSLVVVTITAAVGNFKQVKTENVHLTGQVCVDNGTYNICVTKDQFSQMLLNAGGTVLIPSPTISPTYSSSNIISTPIPTTSPAVTPEATSTPEITPTPSQTPTASTTPSVTPTPEVTPTPSVEPTPTPTLTPSPTVAPDAETPVIL